MILNSFNKINRQYTNIVGKYKIYLYNVQALQIGRKVSA